jgi:multiple sugar transport system permease protein
VAVSIAFNVVFCAMAGFAFAKKRFAFRNVIFMLFLLTMMIPSQVKMIPTFLIMRDLDWLNTYQALVLPILNAFGVFLMRQFCLGIPDSLLEAAKIDGCRESQLFFRIVMPILKPASISLSIFTFVTVWNDFLWPLVIVTSDSMKTLTLGLSTLQGSYGTNYGLVMAGSVLTFLPPFIFYLFLQRTFVEGVVVSGIKE